MFRKLQKWCINYLTRNLLVGITEKDILAITNKGWFMEKRKLSPEEVVFLKEEAEALKKSLLWKLMADDLRWQANLRMFEKSAEGGNSVFGRAMLYNVEVIRQYLERVIKL